MVPDVDVLRASMKAVVFCKVKGSLVVTVDGDGVLVSTKDFPKEISKPDGLLGRMRECHVFRLNRGQCDDFLSF